MSSKSKPINKFCPRSGKPVAGDSLSEYRAVVVCFCNPGCRDDFAPNVEERPSERHYFEVPNKDPEIDKL